MNIQPPEKTRRKVVLILRCVLWPLWALLLLFPFLFACTIALILNNPSTQPAPDPRSIHVLAIVALMGGSLSIAFTQIGRLVTLRILTSRDAWRGTAIAYPILKFVCWAGCAGVVYFSLVICLIARSFWPGLAIAAPVWLGIAVDFPRFHPFKKLERSLAVNR